MPTASDNGALRVLKVADLPVECSGPAWMIEDIWARQAVGVLGGAPKCCKTYLALEMALSVASGTACLGRFAVQDPGAVLLFAAEDAPAQIRHRLRGLATARGVDFDALPVFLILDEQLRLDLQADREKLTAAVAHYRPRLLILDPFVRLHRLQENSATEVSALLADLRALQRRFDLAILLVHHTRKGAGAVAGQALRGSGDLHAWGDSNLYIKKDHDHLRLTAEHRAAKAPEPITLTLTGDDAHLDVTASHAHAHPIRLDQQILDALHRHPAPLTQTQLRAALKVRNQSLTAALRQLQAQNRINRANGGWTLPTRTRDDHPSLFSDRNA